MTSILKKIFLTSDGTFPILQILLGIVIGIIGILIYIKFFTIESDDTLELIQLTEDVPGHIEKKEVDKSDNDQVPFIVNIDSLPNIPIQEISSTDGELFEIDELQELLEEPKEASKEVVEVST